MFLGSLVIGLVVTVGAVAHSPGEQTLFLGLAWAALVGLMVPQLFETRRDAQALGAARMREARQRVVNHDMASALLTMEGGIMALRIAAKDEQVDRPDTAAGEVEEIAHALEVEIRRIRRTWASAEESAKKCTVAEALDPLISLHRASGVRVDTLLEPDAEIAIPADDLVRVLANVLDNCAKHATGAIVQVSGYSYEDRYHLIVRDDGPGMPASMADRALERGVSSRADGGLGLFSARMLIEAVGGSVQIKSSRAGTAVTVQIPTIPAQVCRQETTESSFGWAQEVAV